MGRSETVRSSPPQLVRSIGPEGVYMPVTFKPSQASRDAYNQIIALAIEATRPFGEYWFVSTREIAGGAVLRFDFARGTEAPHSLSFVTESDDLEHEAFYQIVCQFLRRKWRAESSPHRCARRRRSKRSVQSSTAPGNPAHIHSCAWR